MKKKLILVLAAVLIASSVWAIEVPTPTGYTPWFSVDLTIVPPTGGEVLMRQASQGLVDGMAYTVIVVGSNADFVSPPSNPSVEVLVLPSTWPLDAQGNPVRPAGWVGGMFVKGLQPSALQFTHGAGATRYSSFYRQRRGTCDKPGTPVIVK
jgi:hypothetical protein